MSYLTISLETCSSQHLTVEAGDGDSGDFKTDVYLSCPVDKPRFIEIRVEGVTVARKWADGRLEVAPVKVWP